MFNQLRVSGYFISWRHANVYNLNLYADSHMKRISFQFVWKLSRVLWVASLCQSNHLLYFWCHTVKNPILTTEIIIILNAETFSWILRAVLMMITWRFEVLMSVARLWEDGFTVILHQTWQHFMEFGSNLDRVKTQRLLASQVLWQSTDMVSFFVKFLARKLSTRNLFH